MKRTTTPPKARSGLLLAICLLAGLYFTVGTLVLLSAGLFVPVILALGGHVNSVVLVAAEFVAVGSVPGLMLIYYCVFTLRRSPDRHPVIEVSSSAAPGLWDAVNEAAAAARTRTPTRLRIAAMANATVFEETRLLGFASGQRDLTIGLPLLLGITAAELRAVLAHEMGHYARGHTRLGAQVYRGSVALRNTCEALKAVRQSESHRSAVRVLWRIRSLYAYVAYGVFAAYSAFYDRVSFAARRRQELEADACAADNFGRDVTADALRAAHALPIAWSRFHAGYLEPMRKAGYLPDEPFSAFEAMLCDPDYRDVLAELRQFPPAREVSRLDSHPTLAQRLEALGARLAGPAMPSGPANAAAIDLLTGEQRQSIYSDLRRAMFPATLVSRATAEPDLPWREWVSTAATLRATAPAADLIRIAGRFGDLAAASLDTVLDLLAAGQAGDLAEALAEDMGYPADTAAGALAGALYALTGHYLVEARRAEWAASWTGPSRLIAVDIAADELSDLVAAAVHRPATEVARLRLHLASLRVDPAAAAPVTSLLRARVRGQAATRGGRHGSAERISAGADLVTAQRISTIRVSNVVVGMITTVFALFGLHAWNSSHSPPPFTPIFSPLPAAGAEPQVPNPLPSVNIGIGMSPIPLPTFRLPKMRLVGSIVVKPGDSLAGLACRYQTTVRALQEMNHLGSSTLIVPGERLRVPLAFGIGLAC